MIRILLLHGMLAGVVAGLCVFALARWIGEPQVERAIAFETGMDQAKGEASDLEIVPRSIQRSVGLLTATIVDGTAIGGLFALVFAFAYGRLPITSPRSLSALLASLGFVALAVVPALKYPANPPSVGNPETIGVRTAAYFLLLAISIVAMVIAIQIERHFHYRLGAWNSVLASAVSFAVIVTAAVHFLPSFDEVPAGFPVDLMWKFRVAALEMQVLLWTVLGFFFGVLAERAMSSTENTRRFAAHHSQ